MTRVPPYATMRTLHVLGEARRREKLQVGSIARVYPLASSGGNMEVAECEEPRGALDGMRVLDVAEPFGAYVSRMLGDLGADVIKIEPPGGDPGRQMAPLLSVGAEQLSLPFVHANLNKRSIVLDVHQPQDQARFRTLARQADVVVSTEGVAAWATRGGDLNRLSAAFPRMIWTPLSPFGLSG